LFCWLGLIPLFLWARDWTHSRPAAVLAALIIATSARLFIFHAFAAGFVRALAFGLALGALYFFQKARQRFSWKWSALAAVFFALTMLTHLGYAEFVAIVIFALTLTHLNPKTWLAALVTAGLGLMLVLPWIALIISRDGVNVFRSAFMSHGNDYFIAVFQDPSRFLPWIYLNWLDLLREPLFCGMIFLGLSYSLARGDFGLPLAILLLSVFSSEGDRYLIALGSLLAGLVAVRLMQILRSDISKVFFLGIIMAIIFIPGFRAIEGFQPYLSTEILEISQLIQQRSNPDSVYLAVADIGETEWLPYLIRRTPALGSWGSEWKGTYPQQLGNMLDLAACEEQQSWPCIETLIQRLEVNPDWLITRIAETNLTQQLLQASSWHEIFSNKQYIIWQSNPAAP